jgi:hypothetical protein
MTTPHPILGKLHKKRRRAERGRGWGAKGKSNEHGAVREHKPEPQKYHYFTNHWTGD